MNFVFLSGTHIKTQNVYFRRIVLAPGIVGPRWEGWTHSVALQFITRPEEVETNWWTELKKKLGWCWSLMRWTVSCHRYEISFISLLVRLIYTATFTNRPLNLLKKNNKLVFCSFSTNGQWMKVLNLPKENSVHSDHNKSSEIKWSHLFSVHFI